MKSGVTGDTVVVPATRRMKSSAARIIATSTASVRSASTASPKVTTQTKGHRERQSHRAHGDAPPTEIVPVLTAAVVLGATWYAMEALPVPEALVNVIQAADFVAVQVQY
jgi:ABC-type xylose transport system permease subunit